MEKKSTVITSKGYSIKVADHMLGDLAKFGATKERPVLKPTPKEILNMPKKVEKSNLPEMENTKANFNPLPDVSNELKTSEPKARKTPVRSKAK
jgi:hypothetical protein